jgi:Hsp20/alpha crystallin family
MRLDLPGVEPKDIDVSVASDTLTIRASRERRTDERDQDLELREVSYGRFERSLTLPKGVKSDQITASYQHGVLSTCASRTSSAGSWVIDPVKERVDRCLSVLAYHRLALELVIDTHTHADHRSGVWDLRELTGAKVVMHKRAPAPQGSVLASDKRAETHVSVVSRSPSSSSSDSISSRGGRGCGLFCGPATVV